MRTIRIYQTQELHVGGTFSLDEAAWRHVCQVLRLKIGAFFIIFNGDGFDYTAQLTQVGKRQAEVIITKSTKINNESSLTIHLGQAISRSDHMDYAIQKAVELGVTLITPLLTTYSESYSTERANKRQQHWQQIAISACEQTGRAVVPIISSPIPLIKWLTEIEEDYFKLILHPFCQSSALPSKIASSKLALAIGPEGGFSEEELQLASQQHFQPLLLGPRILRTETATSAAISLAQWLWGDWQ